ncbi:hypothetical protein ABZP36_006062 [Zizania latifolia]
MAKQSCCHRKKLRRGLWSPEEDAKLMNHIAKYGHGCWSSVPKLAGLERCGKSCRLRWINYLRPDLKRGTFSQEEEELIIQLHSMLGNRWSQIAAQLPGRTDNEVKNFWNSYIKKKLRGRGIDPATHKPLADTTTTAAAAPSGGARGVVATSTAASCRRAVFSDAEFIPTVQAPPLVDVEPTIPQLDGVETPLEYWSMAPSSLSGYHQALNLHQQAAFDMDALQHCGAGGVPPALVVPSASSSSTLTSIAGLSPAAADGAEQCTNVAAANLLPWLDLAHNDNAAVVNAHVGVDHYAGALDELRWSDYFDGAFQAAAATQQGQCLYDDGGGGKDDVDAVQFVDVHNWC